MLKKRIIPCLDVMNGKVTKGVNFLGNKEIADPVELAEFYSDAGADELVFYDIAASVDGRKLFVDILKKVAQKVFIPLTVGGGISTIDDFDRVLKCGADKVSVNSGRLPMRDLSDRLQAATEASAWLFRPTLKGRAASTGFTATAGGLILAKMQLSGLNAVLTKVPVKLC